MPDILVIEDVQFAEETVQAVDARLLHRELESKRDFSNWVKQYTESGDWIENKDFIVFAIQGENPQGGRPSKEYALSLEMAEHIAMMTRTDRGRDVRDYFRRMRDERNTLREVPSLSQAELTLRIAQQQVDQEKRLAAAEERLALLESTQRALPPARTPPEGWTVTEWTKRYGTWLAKPLWKALTFRCRQLEPTAERFRPDGGDFRVPYYRAETIEQAYAEVTSQLSLIDMPGKRRRAR